MQDSSATDLLPKDYTHEVATLWLFQSIIHAHLTRELKLLLPGSPGMRGLFAYKEEYAPDNPELIPIEDVPPTNLFMSLCSPSGYRVTALDEIIHLLGSAESSRNTSRLVLMILSDLKVVQVLIGHLVQPSHEWTTALNKEMDAILRTPNAAVAEFGITARRLERAEAALQLSSYPDFEQDMKHRENLRIQFSPLRIELEGYLDELWKTVDDVCSNTTGWNFKEKFNSMFKNSNGPKEADWTGPKPVLTAYTIFQPAERKVLEIEIIQSRPASTNRDSSEDPLPYSSLVRGLSNESPSLVDNSSGKEEEAFKSDLNLESDGKENSGHCQGKEVPQAPNFRHHDEVLGGEREVETPARTYTAIEECPQESAEDSPPLIQDIIDIERAAVLESDPFAVKGLLDTLPDGFLKPETAKASPRVRPVNSEKPSHRTYRDAVQNTIDAPVLSHLPAKLIWVNKRSLATFAVLLQDLSGRLLWEDVKKAMGDAGFAVMPAKGKGSRWIFVPKPELGLKNISVHASHEAEILWQKVLAMQKDLRDEYGWTIESFGLGSSKDDNEE